MRKAIRVVLWVGVVALSLGTWAVAQTSVTLTAPAPGYSYDGIYVSPYYATVGGVANTPVVCDDFYDESTKSTWTATITPFSGISQSNTSWGLAEKVAGETLSQTLSQYNAVAWLTLKVLQQTPGTLGQIDYSFALWAVFDPSGVENWLTTHNPGSGAPETVTQLCSTIFGSKGCAWTSADPLGGYLLQAFNASVPSGGYNLEVISPDLTGSTSICQAGTGCAAQEFIARVPEGGAAIAYLVLAGLCCFGAMFLRSRRQTGTITAA
jgi:hypothetical protein